MYSFEVVQWGNLRVCNRSSRRAMSKLHFVGNAREGLALKVWLPRSLPKSVKTITTHVFTPPQKDLFRGPWHFFSRTASVMGEVTIPQGIAAVNHSPPAGFQVDDGTGQRSLPS